METATVGGSRQRRIVIGSILASIVLCSYFVAQGATRLLAESFLAVGERPTHPPARRSPDATDDRRHKSAEQILERNLFAAPPPAAAPPPTAPTDIVDPNAPLADCDGSVRLVSSVVNSRTPEWSFAAITDATGKSLLYRTGMRIGERELVGIREAKVFLRQAGAVCQLAMFSSAPRTATPPRPGAPPVIATTTGDAPPADFDPGNTSPGGISPEELDANITKQSDTRYTINRTLVDKLLENQAAMMSAARIIPQTEGGRTVGVKLYGIRRNALLGKLGMQNGDMLRTINGFDMTSPDSALEAYARLRNANSLSVQVVRRGQTINLDYGIQ